ncbi:MAG TPA: hypothetical protein VJ953_18445 [Saprospiraceae bacterium]|nr:hypothetical protein [Saprospiraceae bacterium]
MRFTSLAPGIDGFIHIRNPKFTNLAEFLIFIEKITYRGVLDFADILPLKEGDEKIDRWGFSDEVHRSGIYVGESSHPSQLLRGIYIQFSMDGGYVTDAVIIKRLFRRYKFSGSFNGFCSDGEQSHRWVSMMFERGNVVSQQNQMLSNDMANYLGEMILFTLKSFDDLATYIANKKDEIQIEGNILSFVSKIPSRLDEKIIKAKDFQKYPTIHFVEDGVNPELWFEVDDFDIIDDQLVLYGETTYEKNLETGEMSPTFFSIQFDLEDDIKIKYFKD